jgi:hypothetical protein
MATDIQSPRDTANIASLAGEIISDIGDLFKQQIRFARAEVRSDLRKLQPAVWVLALGTGTLALGTLLFALMLVHLLHWLSLPAGTVTVGIPLWGCFGIVSAVFLGVGGIMSYAGCQMWQKNNPLPDETAQSIKENVEWIVNSK